MQRLYDINPHEQISFQIRATVVDSESAAFAALQHFQVCYPADPRSFFATAVERTVATGVLDTLKEKWPSAFRNHHSLRNQVCAVLVPCGEWPLNCHLCAARQACRRSRSTIFK